MIACCQLCTCKRSILQCRKYCLIREELQNFVMKFFLCLRDLWYDGHCNIYLFSCKPDHCFENVWMGNQPLLENVV